MSTPISHFIQIPESEAITGKAELAPCCWVASSHPTPMGTKMIFIKQIDSPEINTSMKKYKITFLSHTTKDVEGIFFYAEYVEAKKLYLEDGYYRFYGSGTNLIASYPSGLVAIRLM